MEKTHSSIEVNGQTVELEWIKTELIEGKSPVTQAYGICFNDNGEILVCREDSDGRWQLPGGKPENEEDLPTTLQREALEEADIEVTNIIVLGFQRVSYPNNPNKTEGDNFYQARLICKVEKVLPPTIDPATGKTWERKFVPADQITEYIKWGQLGEVMFKDAIEVYSK